MFRGGAGGLGGRNVGVDPAHALHHVFDIGGDVAPLLDDVLAAVAVDPAPGLGVFLSTGLLLLLA